MTPKVSVIIPTWNTCNITLKCVNTIIKNTPPLFVEIIIVDNFSTDDTYAIFSKLKSVKYIQNKSNLGFSKANNIGAKYATGEMLFFLNSDMELIDNSFTKMYRYYLGHSNIGIIGPMLLNPDLTPQGSVFNDQSPINAFKEYWLGKNTYSKYFPENNKPKIVLAISGGAMLINKDLFDSIGGWNEKYFMYFEDLDICQKTKQKHKDVYYFPETKIIHRHGSSGHAVTDSSNQWRRLVPSSIIFHGIFKHKLITLIIWSSRQWQRLKLAISHSL